MKESLKLFMTFTISLFWIMMATMGWAALAGGKPISRGIVMFAFTPVIFIFLLVISFTSLFMPATAEMLWDSFEYMGKAFDLLSNENLFNR